MTDKRISSLPQAAFRDYLLGALSEAEMEKAEEQYFSDGALLAQYEQAEDELIDDYLAGRLDAKQRARFETHYLARPTGRERYELARALRQRTLQPRATRRAMQFGALAAGLALVSITLYLSYERQSTSLPDPTVVASLIVPAIQLRGDQSLATAQLTANTSALELRFERSESALQPPFAAEIRNLAGDVVWSGPATPTQDAGSESSLAVVRVPAEKLIDGDYFAELRSLAGTAQSEPDRYAFRVVRR